MCSKLSPSENNNSHHLAQESSPKFYCKPALFESKSQVMGNWIVFHRNLSDAAKILIFALNGIFTCTHTWVPVQCDLQKRLSWGRDKMKNTVDECEKFGFIRTRQMRNENGEWGRKDFEFCIDASFKEKTIDHSQEKPPHIESEPFTENPLTDNPLTENQTLPCSKNKTSSLEEQQTTPLSVVVPLENEKRDMLRGFEISENVVTELVTFDIDRIQNAIQSLRKAQANEGVPNPQGFLITAIREGWKPSKTKEDLNIELEKQQSHALRCHTLNKMKAMQMLKENSHEFDENYFFKVSDSVELKTKKGLALIYFQENNCLQILAQYIQKKGKI